MEVTRKIYRVELEVNMEIAGVKGTALVRTVVQLKVGRLMKAVEKIQILDLNQLDQ